MDAAVQHSKGIVSLSCIRMSGSCCPRDIRLIYLTLVVAITKQMISLVLLLGTTTIHCNKSTQQNCCTLFIICVEIVDSGWLLHCKYTFIKKKTSKRESL